MLMFVLAPAVSPTLGPLEEALSAALGKHIDTSPAPTSGEFGGGGGGKDTDRYRKINHLISTFLKHLYVDIHVHVNCKSSIYKNFNTVVQRGRFGIMFCLILIYTSAIFKKLLL
jgi:hypothetical protein